MLTIARSRILGLSAAVGGLALLLSTGLPPAAAQAASVQASPIPQGTARIWFYRSYEPYGSRNYTTVLLNGSPVAAVPPEGVAFYRDVAPGQYRISAESKDRDVNQDSVVELAAGQQAFVKIFGYTRETGGDKAVFSFDTFYARLVPPQIAEAEMAGAQ